MAHYRKFFRKLSCIIALLAVCGMVLGLGAPAVHADETKAETAAQTEKTRQAETSAPAESEEKESEAKEKSADKTAKASEQTEAETEEKRPAFAEELSAGGIHIKLKAGKGVFPEGTKAAAVPVSSQTAIKAAQGIFKEDVVDAAAVDISFYYKGKETEPDGADVRVSLSLDDAIEGSEQHLVHIKDNGAVEVVNAASLDKDSAAFDAGSFSIYAIVGTDAVTRRTYRFYSEDKLLDTQIIKNGDTLEEPGKPEKEGCVFTGWVDKDGKEFSRFGVISDIPEHAQDEEVVLRAKFEDAYYVTFHGMNGQIIDQMKAADQETVDISGITFQTPSGEYLSGWTRREDMKEDESGLIRDSVIIKGESMDLYPVVKDVVWVLFDGNDQNDGDPTARASITPAQCVR